jgi:DNA polymerase III alpha subunit
MISDNYGRQIYTEQDLCELYLTDPDIKLKNVLVVEPITFDPALEIENIPELVQYTLSDQTIQEFDSEYVSNWYMPEEYKQFDIAKYVLEQCTCEEELQRAGKELLLFQERDMFTLLQYLKFLVDLMRSHNIVWGVGRGSSVSSFVLFLLDVHRINSLEFDLPIEEFLK